MVILWECGWYIKDRYRFYSHLIANHGRGERQQWWSGFFFFELTVQMSLTDTAVVKRATGGSFLYVFFIYLFNIKVKPYKNVNGVRMFYALQSIILLHEATSSRKAGEVGHKKEIEKSGRVMIIFKPNNTSCILAH